MARLVFLFFIELFSLDNGYLDLYRGVILWLFFVVLILKERMFFLESCNLGMLLLESDSV